MPKEQLDINDEDLVAEELADSLDVDVEDLSVSDASSFNSVTVKEVSYGRGYEFLVFANEEDAVSAAEEYVEDQLDSEPELFDQEWLIEFVNEEKLKRVAEQILNEDEYVEEMAKYETEDFWKLAEELGVVEEMPEEDEDGDLPDPDTKVEEVKEAWVQDKLKQGAMEAIEDIFEDDKQKMEWLQTNVGIDISKAAEASVSQDGWEHFLARHDGNSYTTEGGFVYVQTQGRVSMGHDGSARKKPTKFLEPL